MALDEYVLQQLVELMSRGEVAVFLGPDLPEALTGVPSWAELAKRLAARGEFPVGGDWPTIARSYDTALGRQSLIDWLDSQVSGEGPGPIYQALAALPVSKFVVATYDNLLQSALEAVGRTVNVVVEEGDISFIRPERPTVVKLLGEVTPGHRDVLLLTDRDIKNLAQRRPTILEQEVWPAFTGTSLLILGQDISASLFKDIYYKNLPHDRELARQAFAVWPGMGELDKQAWAQDKVTVIEANPLEFVRQLLRILEGKPRVPPPVALPPPPILVPQPSVEETQPTPLTRGVLEPGNPRPEPGLPPIKQLFQTLMALTFALLIITAAFIALAVWVTPGQLVPVIVAVVLTLILVTVFALVVVRIFSPKVGERLIMRVIEALPLIGRIAGVPREDATPQQGSDTGTGAENGG